MAGLADEHRARLAAGVVENLGRDEVVIEDDVGRAQRPHRLQRQKLGEIRRARVAVGVFKRAVGKPLPEIAPRAKAREPG